MPSRNSRKIAFVLLIALAGLPAVSGQLPPASGLVLPADSDFNMDGYSDLAIGVPAEDFSTTNSVGGIAVVYGSPDGLVGAGNQFFYQGTPEVVDDPEEDDRFGAALAPGDFNNDGFDDLAVGVPGEDINGFAAAGMVHVFFGSESGLGASGSRIYHQDTVENGSKMKEKAELADGFGSTLVAGNFGKSDSDDLVIGVEAESVGDKADAGAIHTLYGGGNGLRVAGNQLWTQNSKAGGIAIKDRSEQIDEFGASVGAGDFGYSEHDDVAIGIPSEKISGKRGGAAAVLYGTSTGLTARHNQFWHQDSALGGVAIKDSVDGVDTFGHAVAGGDFGKSEEDDLAIGASDEKVAGDNSGAVNVLYGSDNGLKAKGNQFWHQDSPQIAGSGDDGEGFGDDLATGDLGKNGRDDLAVGNFRDKVSGITFAGSAEVIYGTAKGLRAAGSQEWTQESPDIDGGAEFGDFFGNELVVYDFGSPGTADLAIGAGSEDINDISNAGVVHVLYSDGNSVTNVGDQLIHQDQTLTGDAIQGTAEDGDVFGGTLDP